MSNKRTAVKINIRAKIEEFNKEREEFKEHIVSHNLLMMHVFCRSRDRPKD